MGAAPVGHHYPVKLPVLFQYLLEQNFVVAGVLPAEFIVSSHHRPGAAFLYGTLEGRQVYLVQSTVAEVHVDMSAPQFLVVQGIMLDADSDPVLLHLADIGHAHHACQIGVFAHVFEVSSVQGRTVDVDAGAQKHVFLAIAGFFADGFSILGGHFGVPGSSQAGQCGESRDAVVRPAGISPIVPVDFRPHAVRAVAHPQSGDAQTGDSRRAEFTLGVAQSDFFFQCHAPESVFHPCFHGLGII